MIPKPTFVEHAAEGENFLGRRKPRAENTRTRGMWSVLTTGHFQEDGVNPRLHFF